MKRSCQYCGRVHQDGFTCPMKPKKKRSTEEESRFRSTSAWTKKSIEIKKRDLSLCRICLDAGVICWEGLEVHHIIPLSEDMGRSLDDRNLITLCRGHHEEAEAGKIDRFYLFSLAERPPRGDEGQKKKNLARLTGPLHTQSIPITDMGGGGQRLAERRDEDGETSKGDIYDGEASGGGGAADQRGGGAKAPGAL